LAHTGTDVLFLFPLAFFLLIGGAVLYRRRAPGGR
jgi:LPXTG-motif cell wall-anchored protein